MPVHKTHRMAEVYKSIEDFIVELERLESGLNRDTTESDLEDVLGTRRIVTDVVKSHTKYNNAYFGTVLGLFAYYKTDQGYRTKGPRGDQVLTLRPWNTTSSQPDRGYVVYSGSTPLGPRTMVLTEFGTQEVSDGNTTTDDGCGLGFFGYTGNRRAFDSCTLFFRD